MTIFHTQIEQMSKPTITDSTIQWACQKRWNSERLEDVSGVTDEEMSAGFMSVPWSVPSGDPGRSAPRTGTKTDKPDPGRAPKEGHRRRALRAPTKTRIIATTQAGPSPARRNQSRNVSKLGRNHSHFRLRSPFVVNAPLTAPSCRGQWQAVEQHGAFRLCALDRQQPKLCCHTSRGGKAARLAASSQDPMAGHNDWAGIFRQRFRDVARQIAVAQTLGDFTIRKRRAGGDASRNLVNASMELRRRVDIDCHMI